MGWLRGIRNIAAAAKPFLTELRLFLASLEDGRFNYAVPRTAVGDAAERFRGTVTHADLALVEPVIGPLMSGFFGRMCRPTTLARIRRELREERGAFVHQAAEAAATLVAPDPTEELSPEDLVRFKTAHAYLEELHRRLPYAPVALIPKMPIWNLAFFWDVLHLVHLRQQARNMKGEAKGYALHTLARHLTENIHQPYLQTLNFAELLTSREMAPKKQASYGGLVKSLGAKGDVQKLVFMDASIIRNAASHVKRWHLDVSAGRITIEDGSGQLKQRCYTFDELESICDGLIGDVTLFGMALMQYMGDRLEEFVLDTQMPELVFGALAGHPMDDEMAERERRRMTELFAPLKARWAELFPEQQSALTAKST